MQLRAIETIGMAALLSATANAQAQTEWWRSLATPATSDADARKSAVDAAGNVYVAGSTYSGPGSQDLLLAKYSASGALQWSAVHDVAGGANGATACSVSTAGDVYVLGVAVNGSNSCLTLMKFDAGGALAWTRTTCTTHAYGVVPGALAFDGAGNVLLCGAIANGATLQDALFASYTPAGALNWRSTFDGGASGIDAALALVVLANGEIAAAGQSTVATSFDFTLWKLTAGGALVWTSRIDGGANLDDAAIELALSPTGKLLAAGASQDASFTRDWLVAQVEPANGAIDWHMTHDAAGLEDVAFLCAAGANGDWWVAGSIESLATAAGPWWTPTRRDVLVRRYGGDGALLSSARWSGSAQHNKVASLVVGAAGEATIAGTYQTTTAGQAGTIPFVAQYDQLGSLGWEHTLVAPSAAFDVTSDMCFAPNDRLVVVGIHSPAGAPASTFTAQLDLSRVPHAYCKAKTTSNGCVPRMSFAGMPSVAAQDGFVVSAIQLRNQRQALLLYGASGAQAAPFHGGTSCVAPPLARTLRSSTGGNSAPIDDCSGAFAVDFNALAHAPNANAALGALGATIRCQLWGRDPGFAPPNGVMLSNALAYDVLP